VLHIADINKDLGAELIFVNVINQLNRDMEKQLRTTPMIPKILDSGIHWQRSAFAASLCFTRSLSNAIWH
jgi:hypothetical protein